MKTEEERFWGALDVSLEDLTELEETIGEKIVTRLSNKIGEDEAWSASIRAVTGDKSELKKLLLELYRKRRRMFLDIYASILFSEKISDGRLVKDKAEAVLPEKFASLLKENANHPKTFVLPIFLTDRDSLVDIYYDDILGRSPLRTCSVQPTTSSPTEPSGLTREQIQKLLNDFELGRTKKKHLRKRSKLWWVINENGKLKIFFRREKKGRTAVRIVDHNEFIKTADGIFFVFSENGKRLDTYSRREPVRALKIAGFLGSRIFKFKATYEEKATPYTSQTLEKFIGAIKDESVEILELRVNNAPIDGSPFIDLRTNTDEPINKTLNELETRHNLNLMADTSRLQSAKIRLNGKEFNIKFDLDGSTVKITCNNRGYGEKERRAVDNFFKSL